MLTENKELIFGIIIDLVERDIISSNIRFDELELSNILFEINKHFILNIQSHEEKLRIKDIAKTEESHGVRFLNVSDLNQ